VVCIGHAIIKISRCAGDWHAEHYEGTCLRLPAAPACGLKAS
jgi:hypothetical protein